VLAPFTYVSRHWTLNIAVCKPTVCCLQAREAKQTELSPHVARGVLSAHVSTAVTERARSRWGRLCNSTRNALGQERAKKMIAVCSETKTHKLSKERDSEVTLQIIYVEPEVRLMRTSLLNRNVVLCILLLFPVLLDFIQLQTHRLNISYCSNHGDRLQNVELPLSFLKQQKTHSSDTVLNFVKCFLFGCMFLVLPKWTLYQFSTLLM
jgi:hypothetical protein